MSNHTINPTLPIGARVAPVDQPNRLGQVAADQALWTDIPGMFVIDSGLPGHPWFTFAMFTGRTRRMFGHLDCPTIERFEVATVVRMLPDGSPTIVGVPGARVPGMWFTRPENVVAA